jgi:hypothetical protein
MGNLIQKIIGTTRDPKKHRDYKEENRKSTKVKTRAYEANIKIPRYSI